MPIIKITPRKSRGVILFEVDFADYSVSVRQLKKIINEINCKVCLSTATFDLKYKNSKKATLIFFCMHEKLSLSSSKTFRLVKEFKDKVSSIGYD